MLHRCCRAGCIAIQQNAAQILLYCAIQRSLCVTRPLYRNTAIQRHTSPYSYTAIHHNTVYNALHSPSVLALIPVPGNLSIRPLNNQVTSRASRVQYIYITAEYYAHSTLVHSHPRSLQRRHMRASPRPRSRAYPRAPHAACSRAEGVLVRRRLEVQVDHQRGRLDKPPTR